MSQSDIIPYYTLLYLYKLCLYLCLSDCSQGLLFIFFVRQALEEEISDLIEGKIRINMHVCLLEYTTDDS